MNVPGMVFLAICMAIAGYGGRLFIMAIRSRSWPSVPGRITTSRIDRMSGSAFGRSSSSAVFVFEYSYEVNGQQHAGNRVAMVPRGWFSLGRPTDLHKKYPAGMELPVFYDPIKPSLCTLTNGVPGRSWSFYAIVGMFGLFALMALLNVALN